VAAEKRGTLTNHAGRVQRTSPAVEPAFDAWSEGEVLLRLGQALGLAGFAPGIAWDARDFSKQLAQAVPAFAGCDYDGVGDEGRPLGGAGAR
jgi:predicted molibdopterin-dependent oxidoreductase YjgC